MPSATQSGRPPLACEVTAEHVIAGRAGGGAVEALTSRALPAGAVVPSLANANVANSGALRQAITEAFDTVGAPVRDVTVVLPDAAARMMLLDFDTLPERESEAEPLIRFRLKKLLPFDADRAALSFQPFRTGTNVRVAVAVTLASVVEEYEQAFRDAGFVPGVILPSLAAALGLVDAPQPTLLLKADQGTTSVAIVEGDELRLVRTIETGHAAPAQAEELMDELHPLLVFYQDNYGASIQRVLVAGAVAPDRLRAQLESHNGTRVQELVGSAAGAGGTLPRGMLAGVLGALN